MKGAKVERAVIDFLNILNSKNKEQIILNYKLAKSTNKILTNRILFFARNIGGGNIYFGPLECFKFVAEKQIVSYQFLSRVAKNGCFGDINKMYDVATNNNRLVIEDFYYKELLKSNVFAFKWLPRKGRLFYRMANRFNLNNSKFRKFVVSKYISLETILCKKQYDKITISKLSERQKSKYASLISNLKNKTILSKANNKCKRLRIKQYYKYINRVSNA